MIAFADSSAIVKLYADEPGCEIIRARKTRMHELGMGDAAVLIQEFENDLFGSDAVLAPVRISDGILDTAAALAATHGLRAYDSVQLATPHALRDRDPECGALAAFGVELRDAAVRDGFLLIPETLG